eukprot:NODE_891_length_1109_cov_979.941509_g728_i0.p1 GENE.NODE_891_length_1109_cov_979.941509_g728_i0~~NODE_891_length_1109_cov_979.941509_g728_i0.p1  ORF type:complete len:270 (+),score=83.99 NODE_891_length_1109_cov_979.941509_g728_i0:73-882(+)
MARGPPHHLKRLNAPHHWMLDKLGGVYAPRPRPGPHKLRECLPLMLIIRNRLKYAMNAREVMFITKKRFVKVDGKVRTDPKFPAGFMDVLTIDKTNDKFRLLFDVKGRFNLVKIPVEETKKKLLKVKRLMYAANRVPFAVCHDGRTIRYPDPNLKVNDTVIYDLEENKALDFIRFKPGTMAMVTGGANTGRVGEIIDRERHPGSFDIVHLKDASDNKFATRIQNVFVIGRGGDKAPEVTLPKAKGVRVTLIQDREKRIEEYRKRKQGKS